MFFTLDGNDWKITQGQDWGGVNAAFETNNNPPQLSLSVQAGRKGSKECAEWFNKTVGSDECNMIHTEGGKNKPDELNFAFIGKLTVDDKIFVVCIGQGHRIVPISNNWHVASKSILADPDGRGGWLGEGDDRQFRLDQHSENSFRISKCA